MMNCELRGSRKLDCNLTAAIINQLSLYLLPLYLRNDANSTTRIVCRSDKPNVDVSSQINKIPYSVLRHINRIIIVDVFLQSTYFYEAPKN